MVNQLNNPNQESAMEGVKIPSRLYCEDRTFNPEQYETESRRKQDPLDRPGTPNDFATPDCRGAEDAIR